MGSALRLLAGAWLASLIAGGMMLPVAATAADTYPSRPITIIVPFGPGSGSDTIARVLGQHLGSAFNQSIVIEDKPGANGAIAAAYVARATADGYTLLLSTNSPHSAAPSLNKSVPYDP